eukprot:gb/GECG01014325.1/.p1 GENE.gb/GECG01014325.1/~~gb/GECG01014325.1/.p1  ORF type:complete len:600 (+),score=53.39 gb/GECG01014325.1/:1-1800(+)
MSSPQRRRSSRSRNSPAPIPLEPDTVFLVTGCFGCGGSGMVWSLWEQYPGAKIIATDVRYPEEIAQHEEILKHSEEYLALTSPKTRKQSSKFKAGICLHSMPLPPTNVEFVQCDLADSKQVQHLLERELVGTIEAIFHFAALVPYNHTRMYSENELIKANVNTTTSLIHFAKTFGVRRFLYCSSTGVVFDGKNNLQEVDESREMPTRWNDAYSKSKAFAELSVRDETTDNFHTLSIRPNGIWAPGEMHHTPKILKVARLGGTIAAFGRGAMDFTHRDNLAYAFICGLETLRDDSKRRRVNGKAFFVTDEWPCATVEFFSPLLKGLNFPYPYYVQYLTSKAQPATEGELSDPKKWKNLRLATAPPTLSIPDFLVLPFILMTQLIYKLLQPVIKAEPLMSIPDFHKATVDNYCSSEAARREIGYEHIIKPTEAMLYFIQYYRRIGFDGTVQHPHWAWWVGVVGGTLLTAFLGFDTLGLLTSTLSLVSSQLSPGSGFQFVVYNGFAAHVSIRLLLLAIFLAAIAAHIIQGVAIGVIAYRERKFAMGWGLQSAVLGFPSTNAFFEYTGVARPKYLEVRCVGSFVVSFVVIAALWGFSVRSLSI